MNIEDLDTDGLSDEEIDKIVEDALSEDDNGDDGEVVSEDELVDKGKDEDDSVKSVDDAENATKKTAAPGPKTKAGMISAMTKKMLHMSKGDMSKLYASYHKGFDVKQKNSKLKGESADEDFDSNKKLNELVDSEATLSDDFKAKTAVIFEAAVKSKVSKEIDRLEEEYKEELETEINSEKAALVEKVDNYLNYVVETWMKENELAIENGFRSEIAETFMEKLKDLFTESYIEVPESKEDLVDELTERLEDVETRLNESTQKVIETTGELEDYKRDEVIRNSSDGLADTQIEKLKELVEGFDFDDSFESKVKTVIESHFGKESVETSNSTDDSGLDEDGGESGDGELSEEMSAYVEAIRQTSKQ